MTKRILLAVILLIVTINNNWAQNTLHRCGFNHIIQQLEQRHPGYYQHMNAVFDHAYRIGQQTKHSRAIHTIPVAVHVVWKTGAEKLSECRVIEQINILNQDFRRLNADAANLRPIFNSIAADTEIEFRLDTIIWTQSNIDFFNIVGLLPDGSEPTDSVKSISPPLDPDHYLNIWSLNLGQGLFGYAYPPSNLPNWPPFSGAPSRNRDGVVLHYESVGGANTITFGGTANIPSQGRTATHEIGHYLGLRHTWGDANANGQGCMGDDGISDTPNCLDASNFDCNKNKNTCGATLPGDLPDMVENYMDYAAESCTNTFTTGQKTLMKGVLNSARSTLANTPSKNRPVYDAISNAQLLTVNTSANCTSTFSATNVNASVSIPDPSCIGIVANDVWFSFTATNTNLTLDISNITNVTGNSAVMAYEIFSGDCNNLVNLDCGGASNSVSLSGLTTGTTYYIRVYSTIALNSHTFDICLRDNTPVAVRQLQEILEKSIQVSPNPTTGTIMIDIENSISFDGRVMVKNMLGQPISNTISINNNDNKLAFSLANESNGIYLIEIIMNNHKIIKKVILQK